MSRADLLEQWLAHYEGRPVPSAQGEGGSESGTGSLVASSLPTPDAAPLRAAPVAPLWSAPSVLHDEPDSPPEPDERNGALAGLEQEAAPRVITGFTSDGLAARLPEPEPVVVEPEPLPATWYFKPRTGTRRILGFVLLAWLISSVTLGMWAWQDRSWTGFGLAATMFALTVVTWAVRAGTSVAILTVQGGQLAIRHHGETVYFDLAAPHTPVEVHGHPGRRDWSVHFLRRNLEPYVVDELMVDPEEFMKVLRAYRPAL